MEIVVATTIFVMVVSSIMALFNYVLKINRRSEALRQATQGMRGFVEFIAKEIRNGKIDYGIITGSLDVGTGDIGPCVLPSTSGPNFNDSYSLTDNKLKIINTEGQHECIYFGNNSGNYVDTIGSSPTTFTAPAGSKYTIVLEKNGLPSQVINPPNFQIERLMFVIRPTCDPRVNCTSYSNSTPKIQPFVSIFIRFVAQLPTGEKVPIDYQTSVSTNNYDF